VLCPPQPYPLPWTGRLVVDKAYRSAPLAACRCLIQASVPSLRCPRRTTSPPHSASGRPEKAPPALTRPSLQWEPQHRGPLHQQALRLGECPSTPAGGAQAPAACDDPCAVLCAGSAFHCLGSRPPHVPRQPPVTLPSPNMAADRPSPVVPSSSLLYPNVAVRYRCGKQCGRLLSLAMPAACSSALGLYWVPLDWSSKGWPAAQEPPWKLLAERLVKGPWGPLRGSSGAPQKRVLLGKTLWGRSQFVQYVLKGWAVGGWAGAEGVCG